MNNPKVSVVIPIYNVEDYLDRCIESVVNQTYPHLEIILVDDGSPDRCPEICDEWALRDERINVIHKSNAGLGMARNTGIDNATGEYICFFDSDDYVDITTIEKCVAKAQQDGSDVVMFGRRDVTENGEVYEQKTYPEKLLFENDALVNELLPSLFTYSMGFGISSCGKIYRFDVLKQLNLRFLSERDIISEDAFFTLEVHSKVSRISIVPEGLYYYFKRSTSLSKSYKKERQSKNDIFLQKCLEYAEDAKLPETVLLHIKARYHFYTMAAIKQVYESDLETAKKKSELYSIFSNPVLRSTLDHSVLRLEKITLRLFYTLLKYRCLLLCRLLLRLKG